MSVVPVQDIYLVANYKETQVRRMKVGQKARVKVDALGDEDIPGTIQSFAPGTGAQFALLPPENATGNFIKIVQRVPVRIKLTPPKDVASVEIDTRTDGQ
jgi:membrane fusion protein (multidrug efflux system)